MKKFECRIAAEPRKIVYADLVEHDASTTRPAVASTTAHDAVDDDLAPATAPRHTPAYSARNTT